MTHSNAQETATVVSSLVCHSHVAMAVDCLGSLVRHCDAELRLLIHDDGSLTAEDSDRLSELGSVRIVTREEADDRMASELARFPAARSLRSEMPLALKLLDTVAFHPGPNYAFVDSDVLFIRPCRNPFLFDDESTRAIFMDDRENCYCFRSWQLLAERRIRLPARVNTGLVVCRKDAYDLEAIEWFLSRRSCRSIPGMREQTAWAFLGQRVGCRKFDPRHARIMREDEGDGELIAGHFTARTRHLLPEYVTRSLSATGDPAGFELIPPGSCGFSDIARFEIRRAMSKLGLTHMTNAS